MSMYKMMGFFLNEMCKSIEKTGRAPVKTLDGDVIIGQYGKLKMAMCYKGNFFFVVPENFQMFDASLYQQGPEFSRLSFQEANDYELIFGKKILHPKQDKVTLRSIVSADESHPDVFTKTVSYSETGERATVKYNTAYINEKFAGWMDCLSDYYGGQTYLTTDGRGAIVLRRTNGDLIAVALEVRI